MNPLLIRRRGMMKAQGGYNTDPLGYIYDGMVLHFDGIANEGYNTPHNPSANVWKELVVGNSFPGFNGWGSDYAIFNGSNYMSFNSAAVVNALRNNTMTLEMTFLPTAHGPHGNNGYIAIGSPQRGFWIWDNPAYAISAYSYRETNTSTALSESPWSSPQQKSKIVLNGTSFYINGVLKNVSTNTSAINDNVLYIGYLPGFGRAKFYLYSLRIYNRVLSAVELTFNNNVDNQRFI